MLRDLEDFLHYVTLIAVRFYLLTYLLTYLMSYDLTGYLKTEIWLGPTSGLRLPLEFSSFYLQKAFPFYM